MSIIASGSTVLDGIEIGCGTMPFAPFDETSSFTVCAANGRTCGVVFDLDPKPHLRFAPDYQLPKGARVRDEWNRYAFESDEEHLLDVNVDFEDGEILFIKTLDCAVDDVEAIEEAIEEELEWITRLYPSVCGFVSERLA